MSDTTKQPPTGGDDAGNAELIEGAEAQEEWWNEPDISLEPPPAPDRALRRELGASEVAWAQDAQHPDYHHLDANFPDPEFEFTPADLELIIRANRFDPTRDQQRILFGLRGATLVAGDKSSGPSLRIRVNRPNHREFRCVIGVYHTDTKTLWGFIGSTVPWYAYVHDYYARGREPRTNMLPTGCYPYFVGPHGTHQIPGCFRLGTGFGDNQQERVAVLRTRNDLTYDLNDVFDPSIPHDNLHPSFGARIFQSRGCQTVRGTYSGRHTGEWAEFRQAVGLQDRGDNGRRFDYVLVTGLEAAIACKLRQNAPTPSPSDVLERLTRLRHGSRGDLVRSLQQKLELQSTGLFGAQEAKALMELQRKRFGAADGVYSPELDRRLDFKLFGASPIVVASRERSIEPGASKIALVIGVGAYAKAPPLSNPRNDAAAINECLTRLGFRVTLLLDEPHSTLMHAIQQFNDMLTGAEIGFIFFAGHGVQLDGENFLLPKDVEVDGEFKLKGSAISLDMILEAIRRSQKAGIVFLDCCRDNPFGGKAGARSLRSDYRGLAKIDAPRGTFIAFSTAPGLTAKDAVSGATNSPFTSSLLRHIEVPDQRISDLMIVVRQEVYAATGGEQLPWENSSLLLPFSFNQRAQNLGGPEDPAKANREREDAHWKLAEQARSTDLLESFVSLYPYSRHRSLADSTLASMRNWRWIKRVGAVGVGLVGVLAGVFVVYQNYERSAAKVVLAGKLAEAQKEIRHKYQAIQSEFLAEQSLQHTVKENDPGTGLLLALEASPDKEGKHDYQKDRPQVPAAAQSLELALRAIGEVKTLTGHEGGIFGVAVTPDGSMAVTGSADSTARVWTLGGGKDPTPVTLKGHTGTVFGVAVTQDGTRVVTGAADRKAYVWDARTGNIIKELKGRHRDVVHGVAVTPDGKRAVTVSWDNIAWVWDLETGESLFSFERHSDNLNSVAVSDRLVVTGSNDRTARVWDITKGAQVSVLKGHTGSVYAVAFAPDGRAITGAGDRTARVWDVSSGKELLILKGHTGSVYGVTATGDGRVITSSADGTIRIWNIESGAELAVFKEHQGDVRAVAATGQGRLLSGALDGTLRIWNLDEPGVLTLKGHKGSIKAVAFLPDGSRLVTASDDKTARIWSWKTGKMLQELGKHGDGITSIAVAPDGKRMVTGSKDRSARVWDTRTGEQLLAVGGGSAINSVAVSADGTQVATASSDGTARLWDLATGKRLHVFEGHADWVYAVALTPDGSRLVTVSWDRTARVWDTGNRSLLRELKGHTDDINSVAVTPDGKLVITGANDRTARVWDIDTGAELRVLTGHSGLVYGVAVSPDGKRVVTASWDGTAHVWDLATGTMLSTFKGHRSDINGVTVAPNGKHVVTGSDDYTARMWEIDTGKQLLELGGHSGFVYGVAVTPDGKRLVTGSGDQTARVYDLDNAQNTIVLHGHQGPVHSVAVARDGKRVITGSFDGTARIWDIDTGRQLAVLGQEGHSNSITGVAVTPDSRHFVTTSLDRTARVWEIETGKPLRVFDLHKAEVNAVAIAAGSDAPRAVTVSGDQFSIGGPFRNEANSVRVWNIHTGKELHVLKGHGARVTSVAVTPDGKHAVTGSDDKTVRVWDITAGGETALLPVGEPVNSVTVMPDGRRVAIGSRNRNMQVWDLVTRERLFTLPGHQGPVTSVAIPPDGSRFATGSDDRSVMVWAAHKLPQDQQLVDLAKDKATRCLTDVQWRKSHLHHLGPPVPDWCIERRMWPHQDVHIQAAQKGVLKELAGTWRGSYGYSRQGPPPVDFTMSLKVDGSDCSGRAEEPNTFGSVSAPKLYANIACQVVGTAASPRLKLTKTYDGTGGQFHSVDYVGDISPERKGITGIWQIGAESGPFSVTKQ